MSLHVIFADGSNPYIRYNMDPVEFAQEVLKWSENFSLRFDKTFGDGIVQIIATEKTTPVDPDAPF
jgi:hypothetical protein